MSFEFRSTVLLTLCWNPIGIPFARLYAATHHAAQAQNGVTNAIFTYSPHFGCASAQRLYPKQHMTVNE
jgi:hypothetical protein